MSPPLDFLRFGERSRGDGSSNPASPLTPDTLPSTLRHYRPDVGISTGTGGVSAWVPRIGANTLTQSTSAAQPPRTTANANFNNQPSVDFAGNDELTFAGEVVPLAPCTVVFCGRTTATGQMYIFGQLRASQSHYSRIRGSGVGAPQNSLGNESFGTVYHAKAPMDSTPRLFACAFDGLGTGKAYVDDGETTGALPLPAGAASNFYLGSLGGAQFANFELVDYLVCNAALDLATLNQLRADYYAPRYGL